jgi:hypothetical protein
MRTSEQEMIDLSDSLISFRQYCSELLTSEIIFTLRIHAVHAVFCGLY